MVPSELNKSTKWLIKIKSRQNLSDTDRDFIAELVSEEARKTTKSYSFILHDMIESKRYCEILIEGTKTALRNLLGVMKDNLFYDITCASYGK